MNITFNIINLVQLNFAMQFKGGEIQTQRFKVNGTHKFK